jgi:hypothetical protein
MWEPRRLSILWASTACYRDSFAFSLFAVFLKLHKVVGLEVLNVGDYEEFYLLAYNAV